MKVALIVPVMAAEDEDLAARRHRHRFNIAQAEALGRLGVQVHLLVDAPRDERTALNAVDPVDTVDGVDGASLHGVALPPALRAIRDAKLPSTWLAPHRRYPLGLHLLQAAKALDPDVVHVFHILDVKTLLCAVAMFGRVFGEYNTGFPPASRPRALALQQASRRAAGLFFTARAQVDEFIETGAIHHDAVIHEVPEISSLLRPTTRADARRRLQLGDETTVLVVARAAEGKDPRCAVRAFDRIRQRRPDARLLWACIERGPLHRDLERVLEAEHPRRHRLIVGADPTEMADLYAAADVMLHPSHREACGTAFVEALQSGLRVVGSNIPPFAALARGNAARLAPVGDDEAFARAALDIMADAGAGARARRRFATALSFDRIAERKLAAYRGGRPKRPY